MSLSFYLNNIDCSVNLEQTSWSISQQWGRQGDTATFVLYDQYESIPLITPQPLSLVELTDSVAGTLFKGLVYTPKQEVLSPNFNKWTLNCRDYTFFADQAVVFGDYANIAANTAIVTLTSQANCGVTAAQTPGGYVSPGPIIPRLRINYLQLTKAWDYISKLCGNGEYGWYVDADANLHWYNETQQTVSGVTFTDDLSEYSESYSGSGTMPMSATLGYYHRNGFSYDWDASTIKNSILLRGGNYSGTKADTFVLAGNSQAHVSSENSWLLSFPFNQQSSVTGIVAVTHNNVTTTYDAEILPYGSTPTKPFVLTGQGGSGAPGQWTLTLGTGLTLYETDKIVITYNYLQPIVTSVIDTASVSEYSTVAGISLPNNGLFSGYISDPNFYSLQSAQDRGRRDLKQYSFAQERVTFTVLPQWPGSVRAGDIVYFKNSKVLDSLNGYSEGIADNFFIIQVDIRGQQGALREYTFTAVRLI